METSEALLRAILAHPAEDTPRLMYADWLEENGESERAEFIRVQCEFETLQKAAYCPCDPDGLLPNGERCPCRWCYLRHRERVLWGNWPDKDDQRTYFHNLLAGEGPPSDWIILPETIASNTMGDQAAVVRRGFVAEVRLHLAAFLAHLDTLAFQPIETVRLTDREPHPSYPDADFDSSGEQDGVWWDVQWEATYGVDIVARMVNDHNSDLLPKEIFGLLKYDRHIQRVIGQPTPIYDTTELAHAALSAACVSLLAQRRKELADAHH